ncbi:MAG: c-type cytochrome [Gammaproteobacteria bacterium]|nr:c-type cytochrome [Gammaproteobacteria bacterium]
MAASPAAAAATHSSAKGSPITGKPPLQVVATAPKGSLHNPYNGNAAMAKAGHKLFFQYGCNGCHGGNGGGGMCPPLTNGVWIYGGSDDTLFRLVSLGSTKLVAAGYERQALEDVVGPMPSMGPLIKSDGDLWKIITWVRSVYNGPPAHKYK